MDIGMAMLRVTNTLLSPPAKTRGPVNSAQRLNRSLRAYWIPAQGRDDGQWMDLCTASSSFTSQEGR